MRVECESCHELVTARFALGPGPGSDGVRATCSACGHAMTVPVAPADAAPICPKCGATRRGDATACPGCGLATARMAEFRDAREADVPEVVHAAWARAAEAWSDPARHGELLREVAAHSCYAWAAGRYRTRGDDPIAQRQLTRLQRAAEATLLAGATARRDATAAPYRATIGVLALLIAVVVIGLVYVTLIRGPSGATIGPARPIRSVPLPAR
jgi:ribosomal protein L40E